MIRVLITSGIPMDGFALSAPYHVHYPGEGQVFSREDLLALLPESDVVLACLGLDEELIRAGKDVKLIMCYGAGYDAIDIAAATRQGIQVANIPDAVTVVTAELAFSMMLALARRLCELNERMHQESPEQAFGLGKYMGTSLSGMTLGIVGMGRIGGKVAEWARMMGMRIIYTSRTEKPEQEALGAARCSLEALMQTADFVSLHCPHTPETDQLITRELLYMMKPTAYLINTARGRVVDELALLDLLREKRIAGAGIDVFENEPNIRSEWQSIPGAILAPHVGSNTRGARKGMLLAVCERIEALLAGKEIPNLLNPAVLEKK